MKMPEAPNPFAVSPAWCRTNDRVRLSGHPLDTVLVEVLDGYESGDPMPVPEVDRGSATLLADVGSQRRPKTPLTYGPP